jgi:tripartite-type tricarboxylate transporter receptor subunit TctC
MPRFIAALLLLLALAALPAAPAQAAWPERPVSLIVPFAPGAAADVMARALQPHLQAAWGQGVVILNIPGASGSIGIDRVAKAAPDGLTLVMPGDAGVVVRPSMAPPVPYDPQRDLAPITIIGRTPNVLTIAAALPYRSLAELVADARARPGQLSYAHAGLGTSQHIGGEMLKQMGGLDITGIAYPVSGQQLMDVLQGRVTMQFGNIIIQTPRLRDGSLRALAVSSAARWPSLPDVPTVAEQGFPGFDVMAWYGLFARAGTPLELTHRIQRDFAAALALPEIRGRFTDLGIEVVANTPEELAAVLARDIPRMRQVLVRANALGD